MARSGVFTLLLVGFVMSGSSAVDGQGPLPMRTAAKDTCATDVAPVLTFGTCPITAHDQSEPAQDAAATGGISWEAPVCARTWAREEKYCVYTSRGFNANKGISFIARPQDFAEIDELVRSVHGRESSVNKDTSRNTAYTVEDLGEKGHGVVARRSIGRGDIYMSYFPMVVIDAQLEKGPDPEISIPDRLRLHEVAFGQLPGRDVALTLARSTGGDMHEDIMRTNSFGIKIGGRQYSGMFPEVARLNHACSPNSFVRFASKKLTMEVLATKDVPDEEELTISYIPAELPSNERAGMVERLYRFRCTCALCSLSPSAKQDSDRRRERIREINQKLQSPSATYKEAVPLTRELLELVDEEHLDFKLKHYYHDLMKVYVKLGDIKTATQLAEAALQKAEEYGGGEDDEFQSVVRANLAKLKAHLRS